MCFKQIEWLCLLLRNFAFFHLNSFWLNICSPFLLNWNRSQTLLLALKGDWFFWFFLHLLKTISIQNCLLDFKCSWFSGNVCLYRFLWTLGFYQEGILCFYFHCLMNLWPNVFLCVFNLWFLNWAQSVDRSLEWTFWKSILHFFVWGFASNRWCGRSATW